MFPLATLMRRAGWLGALLFACLCAPVLAEPLRLTSSAQAPYFLPGGQGFLDRLIPEVFRRAGAEAEAVQYDAAARANINANAGIDDGVAMRSRAIGSDFPNLLLVDEKVIDMEFVVFTLRRDLKIAGFASLQALRVGLITGWKAVEDGILPDTSVTRAGNAEQLFNMLQSGHVDAVIFERWMGQHLLAQRKLPARTVLPPLLTTPLYIQLHKKHAALVEPVARALRAMKADGSYQRLIAQTLTACGPTAQAAHVATPGKECP